MLFLIEKVRWNKQRNLAKHAWTGHACLSRQSTSLRLTLDRDGEQDALVDLTEAEPTEILVKESLKEPPKEPPKESLDREGSITPPPQFFTRLTQLDQVK